MKWEAMLVRASCAAVVLWVIAGIVSDGFRSDGSDTNMAVAGGLTFGEQPGAGTATLVPVAQTLGGNPETGGIANYVPREIQLSEAHWQGMDVMRLSGELRKKLKYPSGLKGLLIDEVTLNAADAGLLAGDVITVVGDTPVTTLEGFQRQTRSLRNQRHAAVTVLRKGKMKGGDGRFIMNTATLMLRADRDLGFAQVEGAPMILPGDGRPQSYRGPCTQCHAVGTGFELSPDPDLITLPPAPITMDVANKGLSPHRNRGPCVACHVINR
jgi:hypothetical protein